MVHDDELIGLTGCGPSSMTSASFRRGGDDGRDGSPSGWRSRRSPAGWCRCGAICQGAANPGRKVMAVLFALELGAYSIVIPDRRTNRPARSVDQGTQRTCFGACARALE